MILEHGRRWTSYYAGDVRKGDGNLEHTTGVVPTVGKVADDPIGNGGSPHLQML